MTTHTHDVLATIGEYRDKSGQTKKQRIKIGRVFTGDDGRQAIKLDSMPVAPGWNGWLNIFPKQDENRQAPQQPHTTGYPMSQRE